MDKQKKNPLYKSFGYAFEGIFTGIKKERNMKIHCMAMVLVIIAGIILRLPAYKWCICLILFGLIMALELVNTAVEAVVDLVTEERKPLAKIAKDTAAGAVLIAAVMAAITGLILFVPEVLNFLAVDRFILYNKERCIMDGLGENVKKFYWQALGQWL